MDALNTTTIYITQLTTGLCQQLDFNEADFIDATMAAELQWAVDDILKLLNEQGGDFVLTSFNHYRATLCNESQCPGLLCQDKMNPISKCQALELFLKKYCKENIHEGLDVNFVECSCDHDSHCELMFSFDP